MVIATPPRPITLPAIRQAKSSAGKLSVERLQMSRLLVHLVGDESRVTLQHANCEVAGREEEAPDELKLGD
jgi:hypothetical protein